MLNLETAFFFGTKLQVSHPIPTLTP